jgi:putative mRNA 3-end processing factor
MSEDLVIRRPEGLYCPAGDFHIDPWRAVPRAIVTHAHADHARTGHGRYLCAAPGAGVLRARLGKITLQTLAYGEAINIGGVRVSLHPAGHVLGSAQVRLEHGGQVWVVSGDYKIEPDRTCTAFEPVRCDCFITESTFALPIYRWRPATEVFSEINAWWRDNVAAGRPSLLRGYSLGKAQRLLSGLDADIGTIVVHSSVEPINEAYRNEGVSLPDTLRLNESLGDDVWQRALVLAPPSATAKGPLAARLAQASQASASGWLQLRKARKAAGLDKCFVLSDHADWPGLVSAIGASGAQRVIVTHGQEDALVRCLQEQGLDAASMQTVHGEAGPAAAQQDQQAP